MLGRRLLEPELREDRAHVLLDGADADEQPRGDARVAAAFGHQLEHVALARREGGERVRASRQQSLHHQRVQNRAAFVHAAHGIRELLQRGHAVLEEVADAAFTGGEQFASVDALDVLAQDQDAEIGQLGPQGQGGSDAFVAEGGRKPHVEDRDIRRGVADPLDDVVRVPNAPAVT